MNKKAQKAIEDARLSIPRSGGLAIKAKYGNDYFSQLRKKGIEKQRKEIEKQRKEREESLGANEE